MWKLIFFLLFTEISFAQSYLSLNFEKSSINKAEFGNLNGLSISYNVRTINRKYFALEFGGEFNYQFDSFSKSDPRLGNLYKVKVDVFKYELNTRFILNRFPIKPYVIIGLGMENFRRKVNLNPQIIFLYPLQNLNNNSLYTKFGLGLSFVLLKNIAINTQYSWYAFNYTNWTFEVTQIQNSRQGLSAGVSYRF